MKRAAYSSLLEWKKSSSRKPLVLYGSRQVGKTWLLQDFGRKEYKNTVYLNFDKNRDFHKFFGDDISPNRIIRSLKIYFNTEISFEETLIIFDEIQECQRAKDSLKYFHEDDPRYHIAAAGSFLGIANGKFPVGQVDEFTIYPLSFYEFLEAIGEFRILDAVRSLDFSLIAGLSGKLIDLLKTYMYVGGMPEVVKTFAERQDLNVMREVQETILNNYKSDFSKHIKSTDIAKVRMLWDSIPFHLAKEKKKFMYKEIKQGGRASEFENAMDWLVNTGLVYKVSRTTDPKIPLASHAEREFFKLYMLDVGLLCAKSLLNITTLAFPNNSIFAEFKGALSEQYVLQELKILKHLPIFYWGNASGKSEVDFILQYENEIVPLEVKSDLNTKSYSLSVYIEKYLPSRVIRTSLKNYGKAPPLYSIPLYMIESIKDILKS
ncbi:MAG: ATP-binding protein [Endomicrobium sp.]|jgi:predicted AAA+ superfamily ATPase|nr:ATP-binding protein [Endomicrobium sp.]